MKPHAPTRCTSHIDYKQHLDSAVREYEKAISRVPLDEDEIRRAVDKCTSARQRLKMSYDLGVEDYEATMDA